MDTRKLLCVLFLLAVITFPAHAGAGQPSVSEILKKVDAVYQNLQSYQFAFTPPGKSAKVELLTWPGEKTS